MLTVTGARVLLLRDEVSATTASGIILPDSAKQPPKIGVITSVGPGARNNAGDLIPMSVSAGDRVVYADFSGTEIIDSDGVAYTLLNERDILGILTEETQAQ